MGRSSSTTRIFIGRFGEVSINAPSRCLTFYSWVRQFGRKNRPRCIKKPSINKPVKPSRLYRGKMSLARSIGEALIPDVEKYLDLETRQRESAEVANR